MWSPVQARVIAIVAAARSGFLTIQIKYFLYAAYESFK
jgi:hypothetical protein